MTILCTECNNRLGAGIEAHADRRRKKVAALRGVTKQGTTMNVALMATTGRSISLPVFALANPETSTLTFEIRQGHLNPRSMDAAIAVISESLQEGNTELKVLIETQKDYVEGMADLLDYSIAFHALFALMGYEFSFSKLGCALRHLLTNPNEYLEMESYYSSSSLDGTQLQPGDVIVSNGVLGVVVPDPSLTHKGRILFTASLDLERSAPDLIDMREMHAGRLISKFDDQQLACPCMEASFYHRNLCSSIFSLENAG